MRKSKKIIALIISALICLSLLTACGGNDNPSGSASTESDSASTANTSNTSSSSSNTNNNADSGNTSANPAQAPGRTQAEEAAAPAAAPSGETVRFAEEIDIIIDNTPISHANPFLGGSPAHSWTFNLIFDRLVYYAGDGIFIPSLATEWSTDDYITFIFKLREDVVFHNGAKFTADDVLFTIEYGQNPDTSTQTVWRMIKEAKALDDYTVQIEINDMDVDFLFRLSRPNMAICSRKAITDDPVNGMTVGTGAFRLVEFVENNYWIMERNDDYFDEPAITRKITMRYIPEQNNRTIMMLNGESQICLKINPDDMDLFVGNPDFWIDDHVVNNPTCIHFNMTDPITGDLNFRMAVAHAIDKYDIAMVAGGEYYFADYETSGVYGYSTEFRNMDLPPILHDVEKAKEYLAKSTYNGEVVEICTTSLISTLRASEIIQQQLKEVGIESEIYQIESIAMNEYTAYGNNQSQMVLNVFSFSASSSSYRACLLPNSAQNRASYDNPLVVEMLDRAAATIDYDERGAIIKEIQAIVREELPVVNMWYLLQTVACVQGIGGFNFPGDNLYDFRYLYWQIEG